MECNQKMAMRAKELAEEKLRAEDFIGARRLAMKAQRLFPELEKLMQLVAVSDVHCAALNKIAGLENWYAILQLNRFANEAAIKKQYRKLVVLLHPDKNKFAGAEGAFKLIGEAYRLLADQTKRLEYDIKYRVFSQINASIQMNRKSDTNSGRQYEPANSDVKRKLMNFVFWTRCEHCGFKWKILREHMNTSMQCFSCQRTFFAVETRSYGVSPRSAPRQFPRQNEVPNQGPGNVPLWNSSAEPTGGRSRNAPAEMGTNPNEPANSEPMNFGFWTHCEHCGFRWRILREYMNTSMKCSGCQRTSFAVETGSYGVSPTSAPRQFPKQNEVPNQGPGNVPLRNSSAEPTGGRSGSAPAEMDTNPNEPANSKPMKFVFWTCCGHCGFRCMFLREHMNTSIQCSSCQRAFFAVETGPYGVSPRSAPGWFPEAPNQGPGNVPLRNSSPQPTGGRSGNAPTEMDTNAMKADQKDDTEVRKPGTEKGIAIGDAKVSKGEDSKGSTMSNAEVPKANAVKRQYEVRESEGGEAKPKSDVINPKGDKTTMVKRKARKMRKIVELSFEIVGCDNVGSVEAADGNKKMSSLRQKRKVSYAKDGGDGNILSPPTKTLKLHRGFKADAEGAFPSSKVEKIYNVSEANSENPKSEEFPDPDFSNFDEKKGGFSVSQVLALKDSLDSMPQFYVQVKKMSTAPLKLQMTRLEALPVTENEIRIPVSCGKFKSGVTEETADFGTFSHHLHCLKQASHHFIYPQKGETWAVFRDWDISWNTDPAKHKEPYQYEFVEVWTNFMDIADDDNGICGIGVYYLEKVEGFVSLFGRAKHRKVLACIFEPREMCRFSHKVPSFRMTGTEREGVPPGSFELDPSALPKDIFEIDPHKD
ncbi:PREDICTED: uncharacterized protein LOC104814150 [Tarenaya hassleriana]|uniref:uncharacterized protein LOC104814150 n=1 Tax=Tarenaya hassleriana TaxID=28532 RepID=UPI00053C4016|nr:PREDICTED: uncharacterized protein LOC104814150 [Tarenaya hassleriana]XP_019058166.1 PREDICTED: uncharacterized protein LOC104814150 [Tarenaya hassleriana]